MKESKQNDKETRLQDDEITGSCTNARYALTLDNLL